MYCKYGMEDEMSAWFDAITEICKPEGSVSPGGAAGYARVSRAGIHKRLKEGRLTAFLFHVMKESKMFKDQITLPEDAYLIHLFLSRSEKHGGQNLRGKLIRMK